VLLSSNNNRKLELNKLILNTITQSHEAWTPLSPYVPMDPGYLYPAKANSVADGYQLSLSSTDDSNQPFGYGLEQLLFQKKEIIDTRIQMLASEIYQRYDLKNENLYQICLDQCTCRNLILLMGESFLDNRRIELERKIIDLEQEKRRERSDYFRDILFLRKDLRDTLIEKLEEAQKEKMFMNEGEESPWNA